MSDSTALLDAGTQSGSKKAGELVVDRALNGIINFIQSGYGKAQVLTGNVYQKYLINAYTRYNQVKTLVSGDDPRQIIGSDSIYVQINLRHGDDVIDTSSVDPLLELSKNILILGTGGIGKSMLMRYFFLNTYSLGNYVPVLLEMRRISNQNPNAISILDLIYSSMESFDVKLPREQFEYSLQHGEYLFLFDGLDEVKEDMYDETVKALQAFSSKYPENSCIITSRKGRNFSPLETYTVVESMMLNKQQAVLLASKLQQNEKTAEFCRQLDAELFYKHRDFAENPLLLSMMFLTFMHNNSIPEHLVDFYEKAYDALYSTHDSRNKDIFRRDFHCKSLEEHNFKRIFSHFCFHTYFKEEFEFSESKILVLLQSSIEKLEIPNISSKDYLNDLLYCVCLIVKDGNTYHFSHRSFQAYFAAYYTKNVLIDEQQKFFFERQLSLDIYHVNEDYYNLLFQLQTERFISNLLEPGLRKIQKLLNSDPDPDKTYITMQFISVRVDRSNRAKKKHISFLLNQSPNGYFCYNIISLYRKYFYKEGAYISSNEYGTYVTSLEEIINKFNTHRNQLNADVAFDDIDKSKRLSEEERQKIYSIIFKVKNTVEIRASISDWLSLLDARRKAQQRAKKTKNFIDTI